MWLKLNLQTPSKWMTAATYRRPVKKKLRRLAQSLDGIVSIFMNLAGGVAAAIQSVRASSQQIRGLSIVFAASLALRPAT
jgi:type IV secretory pathway VirB2 component (pilin)